MNTETMNHAKASPSDYRRWSQCPGAITLQAKLDEQGLLPADDAGEAAEEGTRLHNVAEVALRGAGEPCEATQCYVRYCQDLHALIGGTMHIEAKVPLFYMPDAVGYVDCAIVTEHSVNVIDLKTGMIPVAAEANHQLLIYALGLCLPTTRHINLVIVQNDTIDKWSIDIDNARSLAVLIAHAASIALNDELTDLVASDEACQWCRCKAYCPAYTTTLLENFDDITTDMKKLNDQKMAHLFAHKAQITKTLAEIEKALFARVSAGEHIDGLHVEPGRRGNKTWSKEIDPVTVMLMNGIPAEQAVVKKPITPTQALKLSPDVDGWYQPDGRLTLKVGDVVCPSEDFDIL